MTTSTPASPHSSVKCSADFRHASTIRTKGILMTQPDHKPSVLFVCVHNAGRSQMGAAYTTHLSGGAVEVRSAGSAPADSINPAVREAMLEEGIDISAEKPKILTTDAVQASDVVITMGCGDTCPLLPRPAIRGLDPGRPRRTRRRLRTADPRRDQGQGARVVERVGCRTGGHRVSKSAARPSVMFVCVKNGGKSQIAAALMRHLAGDAVEVYSAGNPAWRPPERPIGSGR